MYFLGEIMIMEFESEKVGLVLAELEKIIYLSQLPGASNVCKVLNKSVEW